MLGNLTVSSSVLIHRRLSSMSLELVLLAIVVHHPIPLLLLLLLELLLLLHHQLLLLLLLSIACRGPGPHQIRLLLL